MYSNYLESVVASEPETYKDIRGLMERCQVIQMITSDKYLRFYIKFATGPGCHEGRTEGSLAEDDGGDGGGGEKSREVQGAEDGADPRLQRQVVININIVIMSYGNSIRLADLINILSISIITNMTFDHNIRLADLQQTYARLAARTLERNTFVQNIEEKRAEKRLLISNIKLAILNMHKYANRWDYHDV